MASNAQPVFPPSCDDGPAWPILICLLGEFRIVKGGRPVALRGAKSQAFLSHLGRRPDYGVSRDAVLETLWPESDVTLACQSLNSLVYSLHKLLGDAIAGAPPVLQDDGRYYLNVDAGVAVDITRFDALVRDGDQHSRAGRTVAAVGAYKEAAGMYRGELCGGSDIYATLERERLRTLHLKVLAHLADHYYAYGDHAACLEYALRILGSDPCREDAHRVVMRCHMRLGERSQALRQFRICEAALRREFDALPEAATVALFDRVRRAPDSI